MTEAAAPPDGIAPAEWEARVDLAAAYRLVDQFGWSDLLGTHLSARVPGEAECFLLNPYGFLFDEITASSLVKVDLDGNIRSQTEHGINPAGYTLHSAVYLAREEAGCAIHTHTQAGTSVSTQEDGLLPITQHALHVLDHVAYHEYEGIATDLDEREQVARDLGAANVLFLRNHGLMTVGRSVGEAFVWMYRAERACRMQLAIQQAGAPIHAIPEPVIQETVERNRFLNSEKGYRTIGKHEWPALRRRLDRIDPSYRT